MHQTPSHFVQSQVIPNSSLVLRNEPGQAESSTGFSSRKDTADSDAGYGLHAHEQETNPTSGLHDDFDPKEFGADSPLMGLDAMSQDADDAALSRDPKKAPASDEAEWGSLSLQSRTTGVSSGSDDSKKELPRPSTMSKIQEMGSHFVEPRRSQTAPMYPQYQPRSEDEAEMIRPRTDQASGTKSYTSNSNTLLTKPQSGNKCIREQPAASAFHPRGAISALGRPFVYVSG